MSVFMFDACLLANLLEGSDPSTELQQRYREFHEWANSASVVVYIPTVALFEVLSASKSGTIEIMREHLSQLLPREHLYVDCDQVTAIAAAEFCRCIRRTSDLAKQWAAEGEVSTREAKQLLRLDQLILGSAKQYRCTAVVTGPSEARRWNGWQSALSERERIPVISWLDLPRAPRVQVSLFGL